MPGPLGKGDLLNRFLVTGVVFGLGAITALLATGYRNQTVEQFHRIYYDHPKQTWQNTAWLGVPLMKLPLDLWILQEILHEKRPDLLIECGTAAGGSAYYYASLFDLLKNGRVITVDIEDIPNKPAHPRIQYLVGSSTAPDIVQRIKGQIKPGERVMVVLDSDHSKSHVLDELRNYSPLVTPGQYLVVEDSNINGHPVHLNFGPGPMEAIDEFMKNNRDFQSDSSREKFMVTFNPRGFLLRN